MLKFFTLLWWLIVLFVVVLAIKNENTYNNRKIIRDAIYNYYTWRSEHNLPRESDWFTLWEYIEPYERTLWRLGDWSYKNILPPDKFKIIKPFIRKEDIK